MNRDSIFRDWKGFVGGETYPGTGPMLYGKPLSTPCPEQHAEDGAYCARCRGTGRLPPASGWDRSDIP